MPENEFLKRPRASRETERICMQIYHICKNHANIQVIMQLNCQLLAMREHELDPDSLRRSFATRANLLMQIGQKAQAQVFLERYSA